jgi:hypothetical protein
MAVTNEEWVKHQQRQTDIKGFLNVLAPLINSDDASLKELAIKKAKDLIGEISLDIKESVIKV